MTSPSTPAPLGVLAIDDDPFILKLISRILTAHHVTEVRSAAAALTRLESEHADVILCDLAMPGMDARGFYQALLEQQPALGARVVFMTGGKPEPEHRAFLATVDRPLILKPFGVEVLRSMVEHVGRS